MYASKTNTKVNQLGENIGRTMPTENLKLGRGMMEREKTKKYSYRRGGLTTLRKPKRG
jgi:hypothetical protein